MTWYARAPRGTTRWVIRRSPAGYSLFYDGDLVCSADDPVILVLGGNLFFGMGGQG